MSTSKSDVQLFKELVSAAGANRSKLKTSLWLVAFACVFQGLAYSVFYPIFKSIAAKEFDQTLQLMWYVLGFVGVSAILNWVAHDYDFNGHAAEAQYRIRRNLGMQLRRIPM